MFRFRLDGSSGVPPYLQLVHQVRQSLLLGYLREGDRLPTVKDDAGGGAPALRAERLGRRYGHLWGLRDCTLELPAGAIAALVGPNGAGKTTLLEMIIGLIEPTEGEVSVFGVTSRAQVAARLARVGYVAQAHPLYRDFLVADMFRLGRALNPSSQPGIGQARMDALGIPIKRKVKTLAG